MNYLVACVSRHSASIDMAFFVLAMGVLAFVCVHAILRGRRQCPPSEKSSRPTWRSMATTALSTTPWSALASPPSCPPAMTSARIVRPDTRLQAVSQIV